MDKIWDRNPSKSEVTLAVVAGIKKTNDHTEPRTLKICLQTCDIAGYVICQKYMHN